ncbi:MAG: ABC transporter substrate-binding protein [Acidobacteriota bacterium]
MRARARSCGYPWRAALAGALLALATADGCSRAGGGRTVVVGFESVPRTLDPHHHNEVVTWSLLCNFYDALVRFSPAMVLEPSLAVAWEQLDGTHWRFSLRPGVRFHNGGAFSSADVVASFKRALTDPRSMIRHHLVGIRDLCADGELAVLVETAAPAPTLLNRLAFLFIVPAADAASAEISEPVGTGPYRFIERGRDGSVSAGSWRGWWGAPEAARVVFTFVEDDQARLRKLLAGEFDVAVRMPYELPFGEIERAGARVEPQPRMGVQVLVIAAGAATGPARQALADRRVRRALLLALDRRRYVNQLYRGNATVASQYVHPIVFGYDPAISALPFAPDEARRLLAEAGFADGFEVELAHGVQLRSLPAALIADLARIGVRVRSHPLSLGELIDAAHAGKFPLIYYGRTCTTGDASEFLDSSLHSRDPERGLGRENYAGFSDPETDAMLEAAGHEMDVQKRRELLQRAQRRVLEELPALPLTVWWDYTGLSSRIEVIARHDAWLWVAGFRVKR